MDFLGFLSAELRDEFMFEVGSDPSDCYTLCCDDLRLFKARVHYPTRFFGLSVLMLRLRDFD